MGYRGRPDRDRRRPERHQSRRCRGLYQQLLPDPNISVVPVDTHLLGRALRLYESHTDKEWGLTDCISFVVMRDQQLIDALTADRHFRQAGFRPLLVDADAS